MEEKQLFLTLRVWVAVLCDSVENQCSKGLAGQTLLGWWPVPPGAAPRADLRSPFVIQGPSPLPFEAVFHSLLAIVCLGCTAREGGMGGFLLLPFPSRTHAGVRVCLPHRPRGPLQFSVLRDPHGS